MSIERKMYRLYCDAMTHPKDSEMRKNMMRKLYKLRVKLGLYQNPNKENKN